jgi:MFS family permease
MNPHNDPKLERELERRAVRSGILRSALLWGPVAAVTIGGFLFFFFDRAFNEGQWGSTWFLVVVLGGLAFLFGYQASQSVLDLFADPKVRQGRVTRIWSRRDSFVMKTYYVRIDRQILRADAHAVGGIREGDWVEVTYYPHSALLIWADVVEPSAPGAEERPRPRGGDGPIKRRR